MSVVPELPARLLSLLVAAQMLVGSAGQRQGLSWLEGEVRVGQGEVTER